MKKILLAILFSFFAIIIYAQKHHEEMEKMQSQKVAYISHQVNFTTEEAQKFWVLYNEYELKRKQLKKNMLHIQNQLPEYPQQSDYRMANDAYLTYRQKSAELRMEYYKKYQQVLSAEKIYKFYKAENDYREVLLDNFRKK